MRGATSADERDTEEIDLEAVLWRMQDEQRRTIFADSWAVAVWLGILLVGVAFWGVLTLILVLVFFT